MAVIAIEHVGYWRADFEPGSRARNGVLGNQLSVVAFETVHLPFLPSIVAAMAEALGLAANVVAVVDLFDKIGVLRSRLEIRDEALR